MRAWWKSFSGLIGTKWALRLAPLDFGFQRSHLVFAATRRELFALSLTGSPEPEALHDVRIVVLLLAVAIGPIIGADLRLHDQLVAFARVLRDRIAQSFEGDEPEAGRHLARITLLVFPGVIIADQTDACISRIAFGVEFGILCEIADRRDRKTVHGCSPCRLLRGSCTR